MANPICISPLKFYDSLNKQNRYRSFAYGHVSPLITSPNIVVPFLINTKSSATIYWVTVEVFDANTNNRVAIATEAFNDAGLRYEKVNGYSVIWFMGIFPLDKVLVYEGQYYLRLNSNLGYLYSEVFCFTNDSSGLLEIEYWNPEGNLYVAGKYALFPSSEPAFHYRMQLKTEIGKPEYSFEEEATKRLGYSFIESQVSKKTYKFNTVLPEYLCDAMRIIRLCSEKRISCNDETYEAISFDMSVEWQEQGDLASVSCEFDVDNIIVNLGGFKHEPAGGDFVNNEYNDDFDNE